MSDQVKLSTVEKTSITFEVAIEGVEQHKNLPVVVHFVIEKVSDAFDASFAAVQSPTEPHLWTVDFPAMSILDKDSYSFHVDVIVDNYFFEAAKGRVDVVNEKIDDEEKVPEVVVNMFDDASHDKKADDKLKAKKNVKEDFTAATTVPGPNNALLVSEPDPAKPKPQKDSADEKIDLKRLFSFGSKSTPGTSPAQLPQPETEIPAVIKKQVSVKKEQPVVNATEESAMPTFDPKQTAQDIIKQNIGRASPPTVKGRLLKRSAATGKPIVPGLVDEDVRSIEMREEKQRKAREQLKDILSN